jgi:hypothetical protein
MKTISPHHPWRSFLSILTGAFMLFIFGCQESIVDPNQEPATDREAMLKIAEDDSALQSFETNYNEDGAMGFNIGKMHGEIYPLRVGQRLRLVSRDFEVDIEGDTAYATLTKTYEGVLLISAAYDSGATTPDTLIQKTFVSVVTRNLIFVRVGNSERPMHNWRLAAISLPEGGVLSPNIDIKKLTVFLPNGDSVVVESPNDYYLSRGPGWWRQIPSLPPNQQVTLRVELFSAYEQEDFVTVTYGANMMGMHRAKTRLQLVSSVQVSGGYEKTFEGTFTASVFFGFYHAVINAFPKQVIYDDSTPVENEMWGLPYAIRPGI